MQGVLRAIRWLSLGGWLGSWGLFALVIAPTAFRVLPSGEVAGDLVAPVLRTLHLYGLAAGAVIFAIAFALKERRLLLLLPLGLAALCALTEFGVTAAISDIRPSTFGPGTSEDAAERFSQLHLLSRGLFGLILAGVTALSILHSYGDQAPCNSPQE